MLSVIIRTPFQKTHLVTVVYVPPTGNKTTAINLLTGKLLLLFKSSFSVFIGGDFNADILSKNDSNKELYCDLVLKIEQNLEVNQLITSPTRTTSTTSTLIDFLFCSLSSHVSSSGVIQYDASDHDMTFVTIKKPPITRPLTTFTTRNFSGYNLARLNHLLSLDCYDWTEFFESRDPTHCWTLLLEAYLGVLNTLAPFTTFNRVQARDPRVNKHCFDKLQTRHRARSALKYCNNEANRKIYCDTRNAARQSLNSARSAFVKTKIDSSASTPKKFWKGLHELMPGKKQKSSGSNSLRL